MSGDNRKRPPHISNEEDDNEYRGTTSFAAGSPVGRSRRAVTGAPGAAYTGKPLRCAARGLYSAGCRILPYTCRQVSALRPTAYLLPVIAFACIIASFVFCVKRQIGFILYVNG